MVRSNRRLESKDIDLEFDSIKNSFNVSRVLVVNINQNNLLYRVNFLLIAYNFLV